MRGSEGKNTWADKTLTKKRQKGRGGQVMSAFLCVTSKDVERKKNAELETFEEIHFKTVCGHSKRELKNVGLEKSIRRL